MLVAYELSLGDEAQVGETKLDYLGDWTIEGSVNSIGLRAGNDRECYPGRNWNQLINSARRLVDNVLH